METGTVTISINEFDRLRKLESDIKKLPCVVVTEHEERAGSYFIRISEKLYTTDESQKEMMADVQKKINELRADVIHSKQIIEDLRRTIEINQPIINNCHAASISRGAWKHWRNVFIEKYGIE